MSTIVVEESSDQYAIMTPDLRLRFFWAGDRWTHAIDLGPGPWQTAVEAVEWHDENGGVAGPTYQQVHLQRDGDDVLALAVGKAGAHHFSASFRVSYKTWRRTHFRRDNILQDRSESRVEIDVADRCRTDGGDLEARYVVLEPPICTFLGNSEDGKAPGGFSRNWRSHLVWEAAVKNNYDVSVEAVPAPATSRIAILDRDETGRWLVRIAPALEAVRGTTALFVSMGPRPR